MKIKKKTLVIPLALFLITLTSYAFAQMGGGMMGGGYRGGGQGMMGGGQGYGPGPGYGYGQGPGQGQAVPNLSPEEEKARAKAFVDEYIRRYLPEYKLEKRDFKFGSQPGILVRTPGGDLKAFTAICTHPLALFSIGPTSVISGVPVTMATLI